MNKIYRIKTETGHIFTRHSEADALKLAEARGGEIAAYVELAELEAVKAQRDELIEPHIIISVFGKDKDDCLVDVCQNIDLETVKGVLCDIGMFVDEWVHFDDMPENAIAKLYKLKDIRYESAQVGNYPPPNIEVPGYWDFNWEFLGYSFIPETEATP